MATALEHFAGRLAFETDVSDVQAALAARTTDLVVVDCRGREAWQQGHLPGAVHLPVSVIADLAPRKVPDGASVVTYCWGPGCNGATKGALEFAKLGYHVKEMIGGFEYWAREGFPIETTTGLYRLDVDELTAPLPAEVGGLPTIVRWQTKSRTGR